MFGPAVGALSQQKRIICVFSFKNKAKTTLGAHESVISGPGW